MSNTPAANQNDESISKETEDWEEAEVLFRDWLQAKQYPFMRISQLENSEYSDELRSTNTVRPDFFVLIKGIGAIAIDVKLRRTYRAYDSKKKKRGKKKFYVSISERDRLVNFEKSFHMFTWCCFIERQNDVTIDDSFYFCRIKEFCDDDLERKQLPTAMGILLEKDKMKHIPATAEGSLSGLLCD